MTEFLTADTHKLGAHWHNPYEPAGAVYILQRFKADVIAMLEAMEATRQEYVDGKTMLSQSPLRSKVWVAAAMKTMGLVEERPTANGSCALVLTERAIAQIARRRAA